MIKDSNLSYRKVEFDTHELIATLVLGHHCAHISTLHRRGTRCKLKLLLTQCHCVETAGTAVTAEWEALITH